MRETLFNWLQNDIHGARCLDLFAGSGALGLEALSRGASYVLMVDSNTLVISQLRKHLTTLQASGGEIQQNDAQRLLSSPSQHDPFDIVFLDPPYDKGLIEPSVAMLEAGGWLAERAWIYIEAEAGLANLQLPDHWEIYRQLKAGQVSCYLVIRHPSNHES